VQLIRNLQELIDVAASAASGYGLHQPFDNRVPDLCQLPPPPLTIPEDARNDGVGLAGSGAELNPDASSLPALLVDEVAPNAHYVLVSPDR
jgi:hypothetical protein